MIVDQLKSLPDAPLQLPMPVNHALLKELCQSILQCPAQLPSLADAAERTLMSQRTFERRFFLMRQAAGAIANGVGRPSCFERWSCSQPAGAWGMWPLNLAMRAESVYLSVPQSLWDNAGEVLQGKVGKSYLVPLQARMNWRTGLALPLRLTL